MTKFIRKIAVNVGGNPFSPNTLNSATALAQSFDATLYGFHIDDTPTAVSLAPMPGATVSPIIIDDLQKQANERAQTAKQQFQKSMEEGNWNGCWCQIDSDGLSARDRIAKVLHLADLVVAEQGDVEEGSKNWQSRIEESVIDSGRPVIVHPHKWTGKIGETSALIAWKPTREATRAVHDAIPFLRRVDRVTVTMISDQNRQDAEETQPGADLIDYLALHGIEAVSRPLYEIPSSDTGETLIDQASRMGADLLVLGAYSHSRLREQIFGGVTRDIIERTRVPALMSH